MNRISVSLVSLALLVTTVSATAADTAPWEFAPAVDITGSHGAGIYHHLESSGRRNIAATANYVAVAWEDNRSGAPQIYIAYKARAVGAFTAELKISDGSEAFEPSLVSLDGESNWLEGAMLLAIYIIIALAFLWLPA